MTHLIRQGCLSLFVFIALPVLASSEEAVAMDATETTGADLEMGSSLLAMGASLLIVIALILVMAWLAKRFNIHQPSAGKSPIKMLAMTQLSGQVRVCILEVGKVQLLVSMSGQNARTLHVFDEPVIDANATDIANNTLKDMFRKNRK